MEGTKMIPTLNHKGNQMKAPSPLLHHWINSYDGCKPLMDIGCAYGINTFKAIEKGIPTIAVDLDSRHLEILQSNAEKEKSKFLTILKGSLPDDIRVADRSISGILLSEVLHFLEGEKIPRAFKTMYDKLRPGGKLVLTTVNISMLCNKDERRVAKFFADLKKGNKWPGLTIIDDNMVTKFREASKRANEEYPEYGTGHPEFLHFFLLDQIVEELKNVGFEILEAREGSHPGYPYGDSKIENSNVHVVALKPGHGAE